MDMVIFGAQGLAKDVYSLYQNDNINYVDTIIGFIDEINFDRELFGLPVRKYLYEFRYDSKLIIAVGDPKGKKDVKLRLDKEEVEYINIINCHLSKLAEIGIGNIVMGNVSITGNVKIGNHICIYSQTNISHDSIIGDYSTICPGVTICGNVTIGDECFIGAGSVIKEKVNICDNVFIGAGSLVLKDIEEEGIYYGHPIKSIKRK